MDDFSTLDDFITVFEIDAFFLNQVSYLRGNFIVNNVFDACFRIGKKLLLSKFNNEFDNDIFIEKINNIWILNKIMGNHIDYPIIFGKYFDSDIFSVNRKYGKSIRPLLTVDKKFIEEFCNLYNKLLLIQNDAKRKREFDFLFSKFVSATSIDVDWYSRLVDLVTIIECIFFRGENSNEINFRLSLLWSKLSNGHSDKTENENFELMKNSYDLRSAIVHGSWKRVDKLTNKLSTNEYLDYLLYVATYLIKLKIVEDDNFFNKSNLDKLIFK
jgi:hypothetical protein